VGAAIASEVLIETKKAAATCRTAWSSPGSKAIRGKNTRTFSCDDIAGVEKWKTDQALKSAWR